MSARYVIVWSKTPVNSPVHWAATSPMHNPKRTKTTTECGITIAGMAWDDRIWENDGTSPVTCPACRILW